MEPSVRPPLATLQDVAQMIDHALVKPELTGAQVVEGLELAKRCRVASATVRPCDIELAVRTLEGSPVRPASVSGFPHGSGNTATKLYETRDLLRRGAKEIDVVVPSEYDSDVIPIKYAKATEIAGALNSLSTGGGSATVELLPVILPDSCNFHLCLLRL